MVPLMIFVAEPAPLLIIVPLLLTAPDNVRAVLLVAFRAKLLLPVMLPDMVTGQPPAVAIDKVPLLLSTILFGTVMSLAILRPAALLPEVSPKVTAPLPNPLAAEIYKVPAFTEVPPVKLFAPRKPRVLEVEVSLTIEPPPEMMPTTVLLADDEYWNTAPVAILKVLAVAFVQVPEPAICNVPPEITPPLYGLPVWPKVLTPFNTTLPP